MNLKEIYEAFTDVSGEEAALEIVMSSIPGAGIAGLMTGVINLESPYSREMGVRKVVSFTVSHTLYAAAAVSGTLL